MAGRDGVCGRKRTVILTLRAGFLAAQFLGEEAFQFFGRQPQAEVTTYSYRDGSRLLADDDGKGIALLRDSQRRTVSKPQLLGNVEVMADRQYAAGGLYLSL